MGPGGFGFGGGGAPASGQLAHVQLVQLHVAERSGGNVTTPSPAMTPVFTERFLSVSLEMLNFLRVFSCTLTSVD